MEDENQYYTYTMPIVNLFTFHIFQTKFTNVQTRYTCVFLRIWRWIPSFDKICTKDDIRWPTIISWIIIDRMIFLRTLFNQKKNKKRMKIRKILHVLEGLLNFYVIQERDRYHFLWYYSEEHPWEMLVDFCILNRRRIVFEIKILMTYLRNLCEVFVLLIHRPLIVHHRFDILFVSFSKEIRFLVVF